MSSRTVHLESSGRVFHAFNRGVNREKIFWKDSDYRFFLSLIPPALEGRGLEILSYCLMPNHFHFSLRQNEPYAMALFFQELCGDYSRSFNLTRRRTGHLFEGPYQPRVVELEGTLPALTRYIHRNPVEAKLVKDLRDWEFSSFSDYCDGTRSKFVETNTILALLGDRKACADLFLAERTPEDLHLKKCLPRNHA